jgi:carbonic anhydrase
MTKETSWLDHIIDENQRFRARIRPAALPVNRSPGSVGVITCIDPRVNLEAIGIPQFGPTSESDSPVRIVRSIGAMPEGRSLVIGMFLAGIREFAVLMHTDCGCCLAFTKIDTIIENLRKRLSRPKLAQFQAEVGEPFRDNLIKWLKAFEDPREAVSREIAALRKLPYVPDDVIFHGLLYDLGSGAVEVVVNGYARRSD